MSQSADITKVESNDKHINQEETLNSHILTNESVSSKNEQKATILTKEEHENAIKSNLFKAVLRDFFAVVLIAMMTLVAEVTSEKEIIFPEVAALSVGLWIVDKCVWKVVQWQIPILFSLAALPGVIIVRYFSLPLSASLEIGFFYVALILSFSNLTMNPAISACMLPILLETKSWIYPITVFTLTAILSFGQFLMEITHLRLTPHVPTKFSFTIPKLKTVIHWIALILIILPMAIVCTHFEFKYTMVPPLIVALVELSNHNNPFRKGLLSPLITVIILSVCASIGMFTEGLLHQTWNIPQTVCSIITSILVLVLFHVTGKFFAPAFAISLVPMIIPDGEVFWFPLYVLAGSSYLIFMAKVCFSKTLWEKFLHIKLFNEQNTENITTDVTLTNISTEKELVI